MRHVLYDYHRGIFQIKGGIKISGVGLKTWITYNFTDRWTRRARLFRPNLREDRRNRKKQLSDRKHIGF